MVENFINFIQHYIASRESFFFFKFIFIRICYLVCHIKQDLYGKVQTSLINYFAKYLKLISMRFEIFAIFKTF